MPVSHISKRPLPPGGNYVPVPSIEGLRHFCHFLSGRSTISLDHVSYSLHLKQKLDLLQSLLGVTQRASDNMQEM